MTLSLLFAACLLSPQQAATPEPHTTWTVGEPAPHVHLPEITTGRAIDLTQYRGKKILLAEFASW